MKKCKGGTNLEVGVHADHGLALCLSETPDDGAAEPALVRPDEDADGEAFLLELVHKLDRAVARVVVDNEDLDSAQGDGRGDVKSQHARISCWQIESTIHPAAALGRRPLWRRTCPRTAVASLRATRTGPKKVNGGGRLAYRAGEGGGPKAEQPNVCQPKLGPKPLPNLNLQERTCGSDACEDRY